MKRIKNLVNVLVKVCAIAFIICISSSHLYADVVNPKRLIIGVLENNSPLSFANEDGEVSGLDVDVMKLVMKNLNYSKNDYSFKIATQEELIKDLKNNTIDIIAGINHTETVDSTILFGSSIISLNLDIISRNNEDYELLNNLRGKVVVTVKGSDAHHFLIHNDITDKFIFKGSMKECLNCLKGGDGDAILEYHVVAKNVMNTVKVDGLTAVVSDAVPLRHSIVVNANNKALLTKIDMTLRTLKPTNDYYQIYNKWDNSDRSQQFILFSLIAGIVLICSLLALLLFVWILRKKVRSATYRIKTSQQEFELAINAGRIIVWSYTPSNKTFSELNGQDRVMTLEELNGFAHEDDCVKLLHAINIISQKRTDKLTIEFKADFAGGSDYKVYESTLAVSHENKNVVTGIVGTLKDITDEVTFQNKLEDYQVKANFITAAGGIILFKFDSDDICFSQINVNEDTIIATRNINAYLKMVHEDDIDKAKDFIAAMRLGTSTYISTEYRMIGPSNTYEWYSIEAKAYQNEENATKITRYLGLRRENTKWKNMVDDLIDLRNKAEAANKLKSAFLANMSHEIRTPLNAIVGFSELIADCESAEEKEHYISILKTNNELLLQLINDVLDLSKIEAGFADFKFTTFEFSTYFEELFQTLKLREKGDVKLINNAPQVDLEVYGDRNRISQIVTNFVTNAFKFTPTGSITVGYTFDESILTISVTDSGIGISDELQKKVFERFEKLNPFAQGTGLGLPICRSLVEAMNGSIGVDSKEGVGSTFWITLPYKKPISIGSVEDEVTTKNISRESKPLKQSNDAVKKTLLIAEDMDNNYILAKRLLESEYNILRAHNGVEAVDIAANNKLDFILMDIKMPIMDGLEATKKIREFDKDVPIIALTAYVYDISQDAVALSGCNAFLSKPYKKSELHNTLNNVGSFEVEGEDKL